MLDKVFCNIPWFEVHINADGTYHTCGAQTNKISNTEDAKVYNVHNMTIPDWVDSKHQRQVRLDKLNGIAEPMCNMCYREEELGSSSKRIKENLKSKIVPMHFYDSFKRSPDYNYFMYSEKYNGKINVAQPTSYHISLGNECNLACKMCGPIASSKIAVQEIKAGTYFGPARMNWTEDENAWNHVINTICGTENLKFVHLIGGETLLNPRFENLIDRLLDAKKTDIYLGFTTNGTIFNHALIEKLNAFRHVDIGVSVECMGKLNDYIRQGSTTQTVLDNIDLYLKYRREAHVYVTVRPVPSALSVHNLDDLYRWCIDRKVDVLTNILVEPEYLQIQQLPANIKHRLLEQYSRWEYSDPLPGTSDPRDPNRFREHIDNEVRAIIKALQLPNDPTLTKELYSKLTSWHWLEDLDIRNYFDIA